jgi:hypothetical protein
MPNVIRVQMILLLKQYLNFIIQIVDGCHLLKGSGQVRLVYNNTN